MKLPVLHRDILSVITLRFFSPFCQSVKFTCFIKYQLSNGFQFNLSLSRTCDKILVKVVALSLKMCLKKSLCKLYLINNGYVLVQCYVVQLVKQVCCLSCLVYKEKGCRTTYVNIMLIICLLLVDMNRLWIEIIVIADCAVIPDQIVSSLPMGQQLIALPVSHSDLIRIRMLPAFKMRSISIKTVAVDALVKKFPMQKILEKVAICF